MPGYIANAMSYGILFLERCRLAAPVAGGAVARVGACPWGAAGSGRHKTVADISEGTNGVSINGVTANFMFLDRATFGYSRQPTFIFPKVPGRTFFFNLSKFITFAATPGISLHISCSQAELLHPILDSL